MSSVEKSDKIERIDGGKSINDFIDEFNEIVDTFEKHYKTPIDKQKKTSLKNVGLEKVPGAGIKQAYIGAILAMGADVDMTQEDMMNQIKIVPEEPYIDIKVVDKWEPTFFTLKDWIQLYIDKVKESPDFLKEVEKVPEKAGDAIKNAPSDFADLDMMQKAKMVRTVT